MPVKKKEVTYLIKRTGELSKADISAKITERDVVFAYTTNGKRQINGGSPHIKENNFSKFWPIPKDEYFVTFRLNRRGAYKLGDGDDGYDRKQYYTVVRLDKDVVSDFVLCIFPPTWRAGDRFQRILRASK